MATAGASSACLIITEREETVQLRAKGVT
ncbi:MAG: hypothetical protein ACLFUU_09555 [Desulfobacteraceae bacterium]